MCGIVGYIGKRRALPILMEGLRSLEYRGYDSAGLAFASDGALSIVKAPGRIDRLSEKLGETIDRDIRGGIAHTRWATHGQPNELNAHPHADCEGRIAVVHNGIIENYAEIKLWLEKTRHRFVSETDTEVLAHLVEEYYEGDLSSAVRSALSHLRGTYGIAAYSADVPDEIVVARMGSPIVVGIGEEEALVASDPSAIIGSTREVIYLEDGELARLTPEGAKIQDVKSAWSTRPTQTVPWSADQIQKGGYPHYMLKEIFEQPGAVRAALRGRLAEDGTVQLGILHDVQALLKDMRKLHIVACGSAYYAALYGAQMIERLSRIPVSVDLASEFRYRDPVMMPRSALLAVSQSGETADTLAALRMAKTAGMRTLGIVNAVGSTIAREVDAGIYNHAGPEVGVASTKAFVSQLSVFALLALALGRERGLQPSAVADIASSLLGLPELIEKTLSTRVEVALVAESLKDAKHAMYLGRASHYPIALEGALKIKEVAYVHAEGYAAGEMKHGPIALLEAGYPVIAIAPMNPVFEKMKSNLEEAKARGARTIVVTDAVGGEQLGRAADEVIVTPSTHPFIQPILSVIPLQLLAYEAAVIKGYDVDKPRNLAKSVTVE